MPSAIKQCWFNVRDAVLKSKSLSSAMVHGGGHPGSRAAPARTSKNDAKAGGRVDYGATFIQDGKTYQNFNFQLNREAENHTVKELVQENGTHHVYATAMVEVSEPVFPKEHTDKHGKKVPYTKKELEKMKEDTKKERLATLVNNIENNL